MSHYKGTAFDAQRVRQLEKQREETQRAFLARQQELRGGRESGSSGGSDFTRKFERKVLTVEEQLREGTIGLVKLEDFTRKREELEAKEKQRIEAAEKRRQRRRKQLKREMANSLSFGIEEYEEHAADGTAEEKEKDRHPAVNTSNNTVIASTTTTTDGAAAATDGASGEEPATKRQKTLDENDSDSAAATTTESDADTAAAATAATITVMKNPDVDTSFLPDREREERERIEREKIKLEWLAEQERIKAEEIDITYSYWDGTGHRGIVRVKKGTTIRGFLFQVQQQWKELKRFSVEDLMYVKEDLIIPHNYTFYDFIVTKARGKSGPLFSFDVYDDVRLVHDATVEKDESHAGKVLDRRWYERHKHIFPYNRFEVYDPNKDYGKYTIK